MEENLTKKGTTTIGMVCKEGIVLAADRRATAGNFIADKRAKKIYEITPNLAVTIAGVASDAQLLVKLIRAELSLVSIRTGREVTIRESANLLSGIVYQNIRKLSLIPGISHFILGGKDKSGLHVYEIYPDGTLSEVEDFISSGSGSVMAYGVLETLYKEGITVEEGVKLAVKCLNAALQRDSATGSGMDVITITEKGIKRVVSKEFKEKVEI